MRKLWYVCSIAVGIAIAVYVSVTVVVPTRAVVVTPVQQADPQEEATRRALKESAGGIDISGSPQGRFLTLNPT
jgi:hypothetical protein